MKRHLRKKHRNSILKTCRYPAPDPDLEIRGGTGHPVPGIRGGRSPKQFFSALKASVWSKIRGAGAPLPWVRNCYPDLGSASDLPCHQENLLQPITITTQVWAVTCLIPLSPNSDQDQFSSNNIHTLPRDKL